MPRANGCEVRAGILRGMMVKLVEGAYLLFAVNRCRRHRSRLENVLQFLKFDVILHHEAKKWPVMKEFSIMELKG